MPRAQYTCAIGTDCQGFNRPLQQGTECQGLNTSRDKEQIADGSIHLCNNEWMGWDGTGWAD